LAAANHAVRQTSPAAILTAKRQFCTQLMQHAIPKLLKDFKYLIGDHMLRDDYKKGVETYQDGRLPRFTGLSLEIS